MGGARPAFLPLKVQSYGPCLVGTGTVVEKDDVLGGGDWMPAADSDLLDDF